MDSPAVPAYLGEVDYRATSLRPEWAELPDHIHAATAALVGSPVVSVSPPVGSGFTSAYAGYVTLGDGGRVFVKVGGPSTPHVVRALAQEARVLAALPLGVPAPTLLASGQSQGWRVLVLAVIEGRLPGLPWTPRDAQSAHAACLRLARLETPAPPGLSGGDFGALFADDAQTLTAADALGAGELPVPQGLPAWLPDRIQEVARLTHAATELTGSSLIHNDLRPDNMLVSPDGRTTILDWNWLCTGPAWIDYAGLLPLMALQGLDADGWVERSPLLRGVDADEVDALLANTGMYMVSHLDEPPFPGGTPAVRRHQYLMARAFLTWLGHRRGWDR